MADLSDFNHVRRGDLITLDRHLDFNRWDHSGLPDDWSGFEVRFDRLDDDDRVIFYLTGELAARHGSNWSWFVYPECVRTQGGPW